MDLYSCSQAPSPPFRVLYNRVNRENPNPITLYPCHPRLLIHYPTGLGTTKGLGLIYGYLHSVAHFSVNRAISSRCSKRSPPSRLPRREGRKYRRPAPRKPATPRKPTRMRRRDSQQPAPSLPSPKATTRESPRGFRVMEKEKEAPSCPGRKEELLATKTLVNVLQRRRCVVFYAVSCGMDRRCSLPDDEFSLCVCVNMNINIGVTRNVPFNLQPSTLK